MALPGCLHMTRVKLSESTLRKIHYLKWYFRKNTDESIITLCIDAVYREKKAEQESRKETSDEL